MSDASRTLDAVVAAFGRDSALGCFDTDFDLHRGEAVLLRTPRGLEAGEVRCSATLLQARLLGAQTRGEVVRRLSDADREALTAREAERRALFDAASDALGPSAVVLDAEVLFERDAAFVQVLHPTPATLGPIADRLTAQFGFAVRLVDGAGPGLDVETAEPAGCGKPDCGKTSDSGGGCTSCGDGCSSCGSGVDVRAYFSALREQMPTGRVPLA